VARSHVRGFLILMNFGMIGNFTAQEPSPRGRLDDRLARIPVRALRGSSMPTDRAQTAIDQYRHCVGALLAVLFSKHAR